MALAGSTFRSSADVLFKTGILRKRNADVFDRREVGFHKPTNTAEGRRHQPNLSHNAPRPFEELRDGSLSLEPFREELPDVRVQARGARQLQKRKLVPNAVFGQVAALQLASTSAGSCTQDKRKYNQREHSADTDLDDLDCFNVFFPPRGSAPIRPWRLAPAPKQASSPKASSLSAHLTPKILGRSLLKSGSVKEKERHKRRDCSNEMLFVGSRSVGELLRLLEYKSKLMIFPKRSGKRGVKKGDTPRDQLPSAAQNTLKEIIPIEKEKKKISARAITAEEKEFNAFKTLRKARTDKKYWGKRQKKAAEANKET